MVPLSPVSGAAVDPLFIGAVDVTVVVAGLVGPEPSDFSTKITFEETLARSGGDERLSGEPLVLGAGLAMPMATEAELVMGAELAGRGLAT